MAAALKILSCLVASFLVLVVLSPGSFHVSGPDHENAGDVHVRQTRSTSRIRACGQELLQYLHTECRGVYKKRGMDPHSLRTNRAFDYWTLPSPLLPFFGRSILKRVVQPGVATMCCDRSCTLSELRRFCSPYGPN
jgi:hypothetical protein